MKGKGIHKKGVADMTDKAKSNIRYTITTHALEKMTPSKEAVRLCERIAAGQISTDQAVNEIVRNYRLNGHVGI